MGSFSTPGMSQKTYEARFLPSLRVYGGELSQKHGCGAIVRRSQFCYQEELT